MAIADTEGDSFREDIPETFENRCDGCFIIFMCSNLGSHLFSLTKLLKLVLWGSTGRP